MPCRWQLRSSYPHKSSSCTRLVNANVSMPGPWLHKCWGMVEVEGQAGQHVESMATGMYACAGKHAGNVQEGTAYKLSEAQPSKGHPALCSAVLSQQHAVVRCDMACCATIWMAVRTLTCTYVGNCAVPCCAMSGCKTLTCLDM